MCLVHVTSSMFRFLCLLMSYVYLLIVSCCIAICCIMMMMVWLIDSQRRISCRDYAEYRNVVYQNTDWENEAGRWCVVRCYRCCSITELSWLSDYSYYIKTFITYAIVRTWNRGTRGRLGGRATGHVNMGLADETWSGLNFGVNGLVVASYSIRQVLCLSVMHCC